MRAMRQQWAVFMGRPAFSAFAALSLQDRLTQLMLEIAQQPLDDSPLTENSNVAKEMLAFAATKELQLLASPNTSDRALRARLAYYSSILLIAAHSKPGDRGMRVGQQTAGAAASAADEDDLGAGEAESPEEADPAASADVVDASPCAGFLVNMPSNPGSPFVSVTKAVELQRDRDAPPPDYYLRVAVAKVIDCASGFGDKPVLDGPVRDALTALFLPVSKDKTPFAIRAAAARKRNPTDAIKLFTFHNFLEAFSKVSCVITSSFTHMCYCHSFFV